MNSPHFGRLLVHSLELDSQRLSLLAATAADPEDRQEALAEIAEWAEAGQRIRAMVTTNPQPAELAAQLATGGALLRRERRRARWVNLALGALAATCALQGAWLVYSAGQDRSGMVDALLFAQERAQAAENRAAAIEQRLEDVEADLRQRISWQQSQLAGIEARIPK